MRKIITTLTLALLLGNLNAAPIPAIWDLIDKSMAAWNVNDGATYNKAWSLSKHKNLTGEQVFQKDGYVNILKTETYHSYKYALLVPSALTLETNKAYSIQVKARLQSIDKIAFPDITPPAMAESKEGGFESNQISARLNGRNLAIHLKHGDGEMGYLTTIANVSPAETDRYYVNTSEWHTYRFLLHADNMSYDVFIDGIELPIFKDVPTTAMTGSNILRLGAETNHRCNMDIESVKMGTGDFYTNPQITSVDLAPVTHVAGEAATIQVTANTQFVNDGENLTFSFVDENGVDVVTPVTVPVADNVAVGSIVVPATVEDGTYTVKVSVADDKIGEYTVEAKTVEYKITKDIANSIDEEAAEESIVISNTVLNNGEAIFVKCLANDALISEVNVYSIAGNTVCRKVVSASECAVEVPNASGVYMLSVKLSNNVSKTFKVLVK